jgi:2,4-dienoyl-CoA reductase-like NADH-dependent reductase (Old Yellow Enzyme family)
MHLFAPLTLRSVTLRNRIMVSPMCQYSSVEGRANDWHLVHLGSRAVGGAAVVSFEATAVEARGRISPMDNGIWDDAHVEPIARVVRFISEHGAAPCVQIAHAGRKASTKVPWDGSGLVQLADGGWKCVAPSPIPFAPGYPDPEALSEVDIHAVVKSFGRAAARALAAGVQILEIHAAHGYLLHEFLSPVSNQRTDAYGGSFENRVRIVHEVVDAVRAEWPDRFPLFIRISCTDWVENAWDIEQSVELARQLKHRGVDMVDCSSGGNVAAAKIPLGPGYQTAFAERIRREASIATAAVGMITSPEQADHVIRTRQADMVVLARELLRDPYWPLRASLRLGHEGPWPKQYLRAK